MNDIRIGRISSIDYNLGMARVTYVDKNNATTSMLPLLNSEYFMPSIDDLVLVLYLSNGKGEGIIIGSFWGSNKPSESGKNLYKKNLSRTGLSCLKCLNDSISFKDSAGSIAIAELIKMKKDIETLKGFHNL